jgi:integrase
MALVVLAATTGARQAETVGLRWGDLDLAAGTMTVRRERLRVGGAWVEEDRKRRLPHVRSTWMHSQWRRCVRFGSEAPTRPTPKPAYS